MPTSNQALNAATATVNPFLPNLKSANPQNGIISVEKSGKCSYVQMKGGPLPASSCHKGGMACEKRCGDENNGQDCQTVVEEICEEVPKPLCKKVMESVCDPVQETVCDQDKVTQPQTR